MLLSHLLCVSFIVWFISDLCLELEVLSSPINSICCTVDAYCVQLYTERRREQVLQLIVVISVLAKRSAADLGTVSENDYYLEWNVKPWLGQLYLESAAVFITVYMILWPESIWTTCLGDGPSCWPGPESAAAQRWSSTIGCPAWQPRPKCTAVLVPCVTDVSIWHCIVGRVVCLGYIKVNIIIIIIICAMYIGCCSQCTIWATVHMAPTDRRINMCPDSGLRLSSVGSVWSWLGLVLVVVCLSVTIIVVMMIVGIAVYTIG